MTDRAKDLRTEEPRPMDAMLDGYAWLPRMIDKARAAGAGTLGPYYRYPCPIDQTCLDKLGISADLFADVAQRNDADHCVLTELKRHGARSAKKAWFDPIRLNRELHRDRSC